MTGVLLVVVDADRRWAHPANLGCGRVETWIAVVVSSHQDGGSTQEELHVNLSVYATIVEGHDQCTYAGC